MNEQRDTALGLLRKARDDARAATRLAEPPPASLWIIGFHAQQSAEKAIKGVLTYHGVRYPFTHDIAALIALIQKAGLPAPPETERLRSLTPFGTQFRYEDEELEFPTGMNMERVLMCISATLAWAEQLLERAVE